MLQVLLFMLKRKPWFYYTTGVSFCKSRKIVNGIYLKNYNKYRNNFSSNPWFQKYDYFCWPYLCKKPNFRIKSSIKSIFRRSQQIRRSSLICTHLMKKYSMGNFKIFKIFFNDLCFLYCTVCYILLFSITKPHLRLMVLNNTSLFSLNWFFINQERISNIYTE